MADARLGVREIEDDALILDVLLQDPRWSAYAICDLDPPFRQHARFLGAFKGDEMTAVLLVYDTPTFRTLVPAGDGGGIDALFQEATGLPGEISISQRLSDLPALQRRYAVEVAWTMLRMTLHPDAFAPARNAGVAIERLSIADAPALSALYGAHAQAVFSPEMLEHGVYYGVRDDGQLIAVAGTHVYSVPRRVGAVGGVLTLPEYRGRGLATATTSAVVSTLIDMGIELIALNVREDNAPAIAAYRRLGFSTHMPFIEGTARYDYGDNAPANS